MMRRPSSHETITQESKSGLRRRRPPVPELAAAPSSLSQIVNLDEANPDGTVLAGENRRERTWRKSGEDSRLFRIRQSQAVRRQQAGGDRIAKPIVVRDHEGPIRVVQIEGRIGDCACNAETAQRWTEGPHSDSSRTAVPA